MELRILGPLEVLDEGRRIALGASKQRALLGLLMLHRGETLGTERLTDALWEAPASDGPEGKWLMPQRPIASKRWLAEL
jgi:DNA-binding SARP family transcriptional activator